MACVAAEMASITAKSGVNTLVRTGAMFSTTPFFASTSHAATITAPAAPDHTTHWTSVSESGALTGFSSFPGSVSAQTAG